MLGATNRRQSGEYILWDDGPFLGDARDGQFSVILCRHNKSPKLIIIGVYECGVLASMGCTELVVGLRVAPRETEPYSII